MTHTNQNKNIVASFKDVIYVYPDQTKAIDAVNIEIVQGEKIGLIGPNGAGKSTFISLLNGVLFGQGKIEVFGTALSPKSVKTIRFKIGIVFQNPDDQLFCPTVYEDVAFGPKNFGYEREEVMQRVKKALKEVGLEEYENRSSLHLGYGEKKLVSIATVLSSNPALIALDEPSSNLDPYHRRRIIEWINQSDRTLIIATHDLDMVAETAERVLILNQGKIVCDGKTREVLANQTLLEHNLLELPLTLQSIPGLDREIKKKNF